MIGSTRITYRLRGSALALLVGFAVACSTDGPPGPTLVGDANFAKSTSGPTVTATVPDSGTQGDVGKQVTITGTGFAAGAVADWERNGQVDPKITVRSTQFVSSTQVIATIDIAPDADVTTYDVAVTNTDRKKGIGSELFAVKSRPNQILAIPLAVTVIDQDVTGTYRVLSDGLGDYVNGTQGLTAVIDGSGNLVFGPTSPGSTSRKLRFDFSAPTDPLNGYRPDTSGEIGFSIKSNPNLVDGTRSPLIGDLGVNGVPASACYSITISYRTATTGYLVVMNRASMPQSTQAYITRTSISPAVWSLVSDGQCLGNPNWAGVQSQDLTTKKTSPLVFQGYFDMRLSIVLRGL
jgi:hypothetical protein